MHTKNSLTREINSLTREIEIMTECYYVKNWKEYLGEPLYPRLWEFKNELRKAIKAREAMNNTPEYYLKFSVPDHTEHLFNTYKQAVKAAKRLKETIFYQIYSIKNKSNEVYCEYTLNMHETPERLNFHRDNLIKDFLVLTATPSQKQTI